MTDPFAASGVWLKTQLHCHTTNSDGIGAPADLFARYEAAGYDVVAITDHWFITDEASTERTLAIPGAELNAGLPGRPRGMHVTSIGVGELPEDPAVLGAHAFPDPPSAARWIVEHGGVAFVAHPVWSGLDHRTLLDAGGFTGLEVFNAVCEGLNGRGNAGTIWDQVLEAGARTFGVAADDAHHHELDVDRAWTWVRAEERSTAAVVSALREGSFYASAGPRILEAGREDEHVVVRCTPARGVILRTRWETGATVWGEPRPRAFSGEALEVNGDGLITAARLQLEYADLPFVRVIVRDTAGLEAWTNPLELRRSG
jgi:predicted metal-dependent phosphoesterase TrpH